MVVPSNSGEMITEEVIRRTSMQIREHRPKKTTQQYEPKIKEFREWRGRMYSQHSEESRCCVTENKLVAFLQMQVIGREKKNWRWSDWDSNGESVQKRHRGSVQNAKK